MYKIKSAVLKSKGVRIEGMHRDRLEKRLPEVQKLDPQAKIIAVVAR
jgi:hypothetical protein